MFTSLAKGYNALQKAGQPQSELEIIEKLCDRLLNGTQLEDRRAALLGLKGLSRDWKAVSRVPSSRAETRSTAWAGGLTELWVCRAGGWTASTPNPAGSVAGGCS